MFRLGTWDTRNLNVFAGLRVGRLGGFELGDGFYLFLFGFFLFFFASPWPQALVGDVCS